MNNAQLIWGCNGKFIAAAEGLDCNVVLHKLPACSEEESLSSAFTDSADSNEMRS